MLHAREAQRGRLLLWVPAWLAAGVLLYFTRTQEPARAWLWACAALAIGALVLAWKLPALRIGAVPIAMLSLGFAAAQFETLRQPAWEELSRKPLWVTANVRAVDLLPSGGRRLTLQNASLEGDKPLQRLLRLTMDEDDPVTPSIGDQIRAEARFSAPQSPSWPGARDPQFEAFFSGLGGSGSSSGLVEDLATGPLHGGLIAQWRANIGARVVAAIPGTEGEIAATLMAGQAAAIPQADRAAFANAGLAHLLAVAGLHMATVMGFVFAAVRLGLVLVPRWGLILPCTDIAAGTSLAAGFCYLLLTGMHVPTERSFIMAALVVLATIAGRRVISLRALALAAIAVLLTAPDALLGVSFQMSFSAVLALIAGYRVASPWFERLQGKGGWLARHALGLALTSLLAGTASLPFAGAAFGQIQIYYVLANLIAVPITVVAIMPLAVVALLLMPLHASCPALWLMGKAIALVLWIARAVSAWPAAVVSWPVAAPWALPLVALGLMALCLFQGRLRLLGLAPLLAGLILPFFVSTPDFLVARDSRAIAWHQRGQVYLWQTKSGSAAYELEDWRELWFRAAWQTMDCDDGICRVPNAQVAVITRKATDCSARLILSSVSMRNACPGAILIDRTNVTIDGTYEGWWNKGQPRLVSDRSLRGARPWVPEE